MSSYRFDVVYRPSPLNYAAYALTRNTKMKRKCEQIGSISSEKNLLRKLHRDLRCPKITRLFHQVKVCDFSYTLADVTYRDAESKSESNSKSVDAMELKWNRSGNQTR